MRPREVSKTNVLALAVLGVTMAALLLLVVLRADSQPAGAAGGSNTIQTIDAAAEVGKATSIELDDAGNPVISYNLTYLATVFLKVAHCGNPSCSTGNSVTIPDPAHNQGFVTSLELDSIGNPVVAYSGNDGVKVMHCNDEDCAGLDESIEVVGSGTVNIAFELDSTGIPVLAFFGPSGLSVVRCGDATCSSGNTTTNPSTDDAFGWSLQLDADDKPVIAFATTGADLKVLRCGDETCSSGNTTSTPATSASNDVSLAIDSSNRPVVAYKKSSSPYPTGVLRCGDAACSSGNSQVTIAGNRNDLSMTLDGADRPILAAVGDDFTLKVLRCGTQTCSSGNTIVNGDSTYGVGYDSSITLDGAAKPVMSYFDGEARDLKLLLCATVHCGAKGTEPPPEPTPTDTPTPTPCPPPCVLDFSIGADQNGAADDCDTSGGTTMCSLAVDTAFTVNAYLNNTDSIGPYDAMQVVLQYSGVTFTGSYNPRNPEVLWPDCVLEGSGSNSGFVFPGCAIGIGQAPSTFTGKVAKATFTCAADGEVTMIHGPADTLLIDHDGATRFESGPNETLTIDCVDPAAYPTDTDGDGCPDMNEAGPSPLSGGQRNFLNEWDYFNPTHDGENRIDDVLAVRDQYFVDQGDGGYTEDTDRTLLGPNSWNTGAPNGLQRVDDILNAVKQYFHDCA